MADYRCETCGIYITPEHGGIVCNCCDSLFCCSGECVGEEYLQYLEYPDNTGASQHSEGCRLCLDSEQPPKGNNGSAPKSTPPKDQ